MAERQFVIKTSAVGAPKTVKSIEDIDKALVDAAKEAKNTSKNMDEISIDASLIRALDKLSSGMSGFMAESEKTRASINKLGRSLESTGQRGGEALGGLRGGIVTADAAMGVFTKSIAAAQVAFNILKVPAGFAVDFQHGITVIKALVDDLPTDFGDAMAKLAGEVPQSQADLLAAAEVAARAGVAGSEIVELLTAASKVGVASGASLTETTELLLTATSAWGKFGLSAEEAGESLFVATKLGRSSIEELNAALSTTTGAAAFGISLNEVLALTDGLAKMGAPVAQAQTSIRALTTTLSKDLADLPAKSRVAFEALGIETGTAALEAKGLVGMLKEIMVAADGDTAVLGKLFSQVEASGAAMKLFGDDMKFTIDVLDKLDKSAGEVGKAFKIMGSDAKGTMTAFKSIAEGALLDIGNELLPDIQEGLENLGNWWATNGKETVETTKALYQVLKAVAIVTYEVGDAILTWTGIKLLNEWGMDAARAMGIIGDEIEKISAADAKIKKIEEAMAALEKAAGETSVSVDKSAKSLKELDNVSLSNMTKNLGSLKKAVSGVELSLEEMLVGLDDNIKPKKKGKASGKSWMEGFLSEVAAHKPLGDVLRIKPTEDMDILSEMFPLDGLDDFERSLIEGMAQMQSPLEDASISLADSMLSGFKNIGSSVKKAFSPAADAVVDWSVDLGKLKDLGMRSTEQLAAGFAQSAAESIAYGDSFEDGINKMMQALTIQAGIEAVKETAMGLASLALYDGVGSANHFASAGVWAGIAVGAGVTAKTTGGFNRDDGGGGGSSASSSPSGPAARDTSGDGGGGETVINVNFSGMPLATKNDIGKAVAESLDDYSRTRGRSRFDAGKFRR